MGKIYIYIFMLLTISMQVGAIELFIPDNSPVRQQFYDIMTGSNIEARKQFQQSIEHPLLWFKVYSFNRIRQNVVEFIFMNEVNGRYHITNPGSYRIVRSLDTGKIVQIQIFYKYDAQSFIVLTPNPNNPAQSFFSLYLYDVHKPIYKNIHIAMPIETLLIAEFNNILYMTENYVKWNMLLDVPQQILFENTIAMSKNIEKMQKYLPDAPAGVMDRRGNLVMLPQYMHAADKKSGFSSFGFTKWIVDALYFAQNNKYLNIDKLLKKEYDLRGSIQTLSYENERNPYFALDWIRNLAYYLNINMPYASQVSYTYSDVRVVPYFLYIKDIGYKVEEIKKILYFLSYQNYNSFYFGSINGEYGKKPRLWQHFHQVVFFPYFDDTGRFVVDIYDGKLKLSVDEFIASYKNRFVHLQKLPSVKSFSLPFITKL